MRLTLPALVLLLGCKDPVGPVLPEGRSAGECRDGADNDGDGAFDCDDLGCVGSPDCPTDSAPPADSTPPEDSEPEGFWLQFTFGEDHVQVDVRDGGEVGWDFGLYYQDSHGVSVWESCTTVGFCHPLGAEGARLAYATSLDQVAPGFTQLRESWLPYTGFILRGASGACWVWGERASYYAAEGCFTPPWSEG